MTCKISNYAPTYGSINTSIKKLLALNYIEFTESVENGRQKKYYHILDDGKNAFMHWLREDIVVDKAKDEFITKLFFYGYLPLDERINLLENYYHKQQEMYHTYSAYHEQVNQVDYPPEHRDIATFQIATLDHTVNHLACELEWLQKMIQQLKEEHYNEEQPSSEEQRRKK